MTGLGELPREQLIPVVLEYMMVGHLIDRALMPQVAVRAGVDAVDDVAIDEWLGASPTYTARMQRLMGIEGDDVGAIMKGLQLDVGFVHQYMGVSYELSDDRHGAFWLNHCGALMDVEPHGEARVVGMCHHIEDPTFDGTAVATNPRARIRPIHRPPRVPADREPHCHWTITSQWVAASWVASERLAGALGLGDGGIDALATVLALQPAFPPGFEREVDVDANRVRLELTPLADGLLDADNPGWLGLLARGERGGVEAMAHAIEPRARLADVAIRDGHVAIEVTVDPAAEPAPEPPEVAFMRISGTSSWVFDATAGTSAKS